MKLEIYRYVVHKAHDIKWAPLEKYSFLGTFAIIIPVTVWAVIKILR